MSKDQRIYLRDILERIAKIERFTVDGEVAFRADDRTQDAVIRCFEVIGEIVKRLDLELTNQYPEVGWSQYAGFRDILIHQYDKVLLDIVWSSTQDELATLKTAVQALIEQLEKEDNA